MSPQLRFATALLALWGHFPHFSVTSWGRTPAHNNTLAGAVEDSQHLTWTAADLVWDAASRPGTGHLKAVCRSLGLELGTRATYDHVELKD